MKQDAKPIKRIRNINNENDVNIDEIQMQIECK